MGRFSSGLITHIRIAILANECARPCDVCLGKGRPDLNAAYSVRDVSVCREHLAVVIDAVSNVSTKATDRTECADVTSLTKVRSKRDRTRSTDLLQALEKIGILEIPENPNY
jgi:hypothetical protein